MQKNTDNNTHDAFSELFRQKLENHTLPVDDGAWNAIQKSIAARKRKRLIPLWWLSAAAVMVLSFLIFSIPDNELSKQIAENKAIEETTQKTVSDNQETVVIPEDETKHSLAEKQITQNQTHNTIRSDKSERTAKKAKQRNNNIDIQENINTDFAETAKNTDPKTIVADSVQQETVSEDGSETFLAENDKKKDLSKEEKKNIIELAQNESDWEDPL